MRRACRTPLPSDRRCHAIWSIDKSLTAIDLMVTVAKASDGAGKGGTTSSNIDNTRLAADGIRVLLMHHGEFIALCTS